MKNRLLIPFALFAALGALAVAGCGGGDDTSSTTGTSGASGVTGTALTETEFVSQANAICKAGDKDVNAAAQDTFGGQQPTDAQVEQFATETLVPSIQGQIDGIRALVPPEDIADDVTTFLDDAEAALGQIQDDPSLLQASNNEGPFADVNKQADALGLTSCAG
jgi:hypothetical protein